MKLLCIFIAFILAFIVGQIIILRTYLFSFRRRLFDPADSRKLHRGLIPRLGGMMFLPTQCGVFMLIVVVVRHFGIVDVEYGVLTQFLLLICGLGLLFVIGVMDDLMGIRYQWKFIAQVMAASFLPISGLWVRSLDGLFGITILSPWVGIPLTLLGVVVIINAFNLIDGIDGLCSGLVILACTVLGTLFLRQEAWLYVIFSFITVGTLSPFFYYNVFGKSKKHRRIFMGDTGSMTLGLSVSFLTISYLMGRPTSIPTGSNNILVAFSVVILPVLDVMRVMRVRLLSGKSVFLPDRNHIHHYVLNMGFGKHVTLSCILLIDLLFVVFNMIWVRYLNINVALILNVAFWFILLRVGNRLKRSRLKKNKNENENEN
ncbi:MAG: undecaprenyl/decaprenyl-phosphate alpha-N-acetylglucosaminyl 1-phosphate transferase [Dysgonamonadaceae bacterium]|jgi:UDP-N-acetylmuramyl pentapeptide phosphotransferase/UDP-N-acetylglucosamine-1-phosphate transferase|nr:undecaprenyl/decaprenyl-phosphate alpha-N-acetylglucosaminyl 1-phosphate transferase [Dysgonamonadaceae bacterium]